MYLDFTKNLKTIVFMFAEKLQVLRERIRTKKNSNAPFLVSQKPFKIDFFFYRPLFSSFPLSQLQDSSNQLQKTDWNEDKKK